MYYILYIHIILYIIYAYNEYKDDPKAPSYW